MVFIEINFSNYMVDGYTLILFSILKCDKFNSFICIKISYEFPSERKNYIEIIFMTFFFFFNTIF